MIIIQGDERAPHGMIAGIMDIAASARPSRARRSGRGHGTATGSDQSSG